MNVPQSAQPITYGVPLQEVEGDAYPIDGTGYFYPSASASYSVPPVEDADFCDIIDALAEFDDDFVAIGPSPVAMPILSGDSDAAIASEVSVSYAVPEACVKPSQVEVVPANAVRAIDVDGSALATAECCNIIGVLDYEKNDLYLELSAEEKKLRRLQAIQRWKHKKNVKYRKQQPQRLKIQTEHGLSAKIQKDKSLDTKDVLSVNKVVVVGKKGTSVARQKVAAGRERENGKFKRSHAKWIPITEFYLDS